MTYTMGSLFAGIGGFDLGFERAGFKTAWQVEIDPYCQKVLAKNFPEAERFGDIRECGRHNLKPVDVICGGFPCQDISNAGKRAGIGGERSGLWSEYARIIRELRPRYALIENVAALVGSGLERVLCDLAGSGFDAEWGVISAEDVGACHLRRRVWILAHPNGEGLASIGNEGPARASDSDSASSSGKESCNVAYSNLPRLEGWDSPELRECSSEQPTWKGGTSADADILQAIRSAISRGECRSWEPEPNVGRVAHGVPKRVDRLRGLGNSVVPQIPEMIARRIKQALEAA